MTTYTLHKTKKSRGFTLIELLVVIGILAILLSITLIAINPAARFGQANDIKRQKDIGEILSAIGQYQATNKGIMPNSIQTQLTPTVAVQLNSTGVLAPLCDDLVTEFMPALPVDPNIQDPGGVTSCEDADVWDTGYTIMKDAEGRITVSAPQANKGPIEVTR